MIFRHTENGQIMPAIDFDKETLGNILQKRNGLCVPINQRPYAWKLEHVKDLLEDLNAAIQGSAEEYFLGSVIIVNTHNSERVEVYDGQQRLATTAILIAAIRDFIATKLSNVGEAATITSESLLSTKRGGIETPHLRLGAQDHAFFEASILQMPGSGSRAAAVPNPQKESHTLLVAAAKEAANHVTAITRNLPATAQAALLEKWLRFLENRARVIWVAVADQPTAYRIFETMNDRGLKLSAADLLKNYLYSLATTRQDEVVQRWLSMTAILESLGPEDGDIVDYIRYLWITINGHTRSTALFDKIKDKINSEAAAVEFATLLESRANDYAALLTPTHSAWNEHHREIREDLETLRDLGVSQVRPLLLAAFGKLSNPNIEKLVKNTVNWSVRCLLGGVSSGNLETYYSKNAKMITDGTVTSIADIAKDMMGVIPADDKFLLAMKTVSVPTGSLARYYLRCLQTACDAIVEPQYDPSTRRQITAEHILPKNPGEEWTMSTEDAKRLFNRLGNQALLTNSENSRIGNIGFPAKKETLASSNFSLTQIAAECDVWTEVEIMARQETLSSYAIKAWPLVVN